MVPGRRAPSTRIRVFGDENDLQLPASAAAAMPQLATAPTKEHADSDAADSAGDGASPDQFEVGAAAGAVTEEESALAMATA